MVNSLTQSVAFFWDTRDRLTNTIDAAGKPNGFAYDGNGNVTFWTNELAR
jgi:YD repeat-containing protein